MFYGRMKVRPLTDYLIFAADFWLSRSFCPSGLKARKGVRPEKGSGADFCSCSSALPFSPGNPSRLAMIAVSRMPHTENSPGL
jgi:hypothetical protein